MEWTPEIIKAAIGLVLGSTVIGTLAAKLLDIWLDRKKRKDTVADRAEEKKAKEKADAVGALDTKVERYKVETDKEILAVRKDMNDMDERFQAIFTNLDNKLDDNLRHGVHVSALLMAQSVDRISYRASKALDGETIDKNAYRNLKTEYRRVCELAGDPGNEDILYLDGLIKKVERLKIK